MATRRTTTQTPGRRQQSEIKRAAILDAAEALFLSEGYELTSVDAIAARAGVSKRTVYDHFHDKQTLFRRVLERARNSMVATVRTAIDEELTDDRNLRDALLAFARRVATEAFPSSDYATFRRLMSQAPPAPRPQETVRVQSERFLEQRFEQLAEKGELKVANPRRAVQHFIALTLHLALDATDTDPAGTVVGSEVFAIITDGVDAFVRAYR